MKKTIQHHSKNISNYTLATKWQSLMNDLNEQIKERKLTKDNYSKTSLLQISLSNAFIGIHTAMLTPNIKNVKNATYVYINS